MHVSHLYPGYSQAGMMGAFKGIDLYYLGMITMQKTYANDLLTHVNQYTGNSYANEPAVAFIEINNENGLIDKWRQGLFGPDLHYEYIDELKLQWNSWLTGKYTTW